MTNKSKLVLHCGGYKATEDQVRSVITPEPTSSWQPIPHHRMLDLVREACNRNGMEIVQEQHALMGEDNGNYFSLLDLAGNDGANADDYGISWAIANSHLKQYTATLGLGSNVFVCDNRSFLAEVKCVRKHTRHILRDLPGLIARATQMLVAKRRSLDERITAYKGAQLKDETASHAILHMLRSRVLTSRQVEPVLQEYREPRHQEFNGRNVWSLFNAATEILKEVQNPATLSRRTQTLHGVCDQFSGVVVA